MGWLFEVIGQVGSHAVPQPHETLKLMLKLQVKFLRFQMRTEV